MNPFHIVENNNVNILYQWLSLVVGGKEFCLPADNMSGDLFFCLSWCGWVGGWGRGGLLLACSGWSLGMLVNIPQCMGQVFGFYVFIYWWRKVQYLFSGHTSNPGTAGVQKAQTHPRVSEKGFYLAALWPWLFYLISLYLSDLIQWMAACMGEKLESMDTRTCMAESLCCVPETITTWWTGRAVAQSCPTLCDPMGCRPPGSSANGAPPGENTGVGCHALLQGIFPIQRSNPGLLQVDSLPSELQAGAGEGT